MYNTIVPNKTGWCRTFINYLEKEQDLSKEFVNYLDKSGNALAESYVQDNVAEGTKYNVSLQAGRFIDGYTLAGVIGDAVYGTVDGNKVINVIYLKNYQVTVRYLDEDNNDLVDPYVYEAVEGSIYNVSQHAALEIEGYELDELRGQPVWGILDDNKIVIVKYTKAEETPALPPLPLGFPAG